MCSSQFCFFRDRWAPVKPSITHLAIQEEVELVVDEEAPAEPRDLAAKRGRHLLHTANLLPDGSVSLTKELWRVYRHLHSVMPVPLATSWTTDRCHLHESKFLHIQIRAPCRMANVKFISLSVVKSIGNTS